MATPNSVHISCIVFTLCMVRYYFSTELSKQTDECNAKLNGVQQEVVDIKSDTNVLQMEMKSQKDNTRGLCVGYLL